MGLTVDEITNKTFDNKMRGFNPDQVKEFLGQVAGQLRELEAQNHELAEKAKASEEKLRYLSDLKDSLNKSILVAQEAAEKVKNNAEREAEITVREAQKQATDIVTAANEKANAVIDECANSTRKLTVATSDLKKSTRIFRQRLQVMLESQLEVLHGEDWDQLLADDDYSKLDDLEKILGSRLDSDSSESVESTPTTQTTSESLEPLSEIPDSESETDDGKTVVVFPEDN
ncbi:DivIVA domain-containing protein [Limosilactobacillus gastricus]|uniref:Cell division initiation protein n=1 Tax=Limosilactobacillus gastricus DSM 16045 TaxID=1423749 RepID=A0A0R1VIH9_9LACO|nr:DivIVA domain-containing protein [Limosilactobacillus gastricus]KRM02851.1 Cell division initiation protein [Limosilactobacillus gastricus DSM 16045]QGF40776.1 DivIVA domain-containing protein [Limosilactobacillus gastricus]